MGSTSNALKRVDLIHSGEAARILRVSQTSISRMVKSGTLRSVATVGSYRLFDRADVLAVARIRAEGK